MQRKEMTLDSRLKEIKERCEAATEGPWNAVTDDDKRFWIESESGENWDNFNEPTVYFIAHARTDVPMLLEMVDKLLLAVYLAGEDFEKGAIRELEKIAEKYK